MSRILLLFVFCAIAMLSTSAQVSLLRGSIEVYTGPAPAGTPTTNYKTGFGPGTNLNGTLIGNLNPTDVLAITDPYVITSESGGCTVDRVRVTIQIKPTTQPSPVNALSINLTPQELCGGSAWRFSTPACSAGDRELGSPAGSTIFGVNNLENLGLIEIKLTYEFTQVSGGCTIPAPIEITGFFTVSSAPLPIELSSLSAKPAGLANRIEWAVASEQDLKSYVLERSDRPDGFTTLSEVAPRGAGNGVEAVYSAYDPNPAAVTYYRLRSIDLDGSQQISDVVVVRRDDLSAGGIKVFPNPTRGIATVEINAQLGAEEIMVFDATGRVLQQISLSENTSSQLDLSGLPTGVYTVTVTGAQDSYSTRLVLE